MGKCPELVAANLNRPTKKCNVNRNVTFCVSSMWGSCEFESLPLALSSMANLFAFRSAGISSCNVASVALASSSASGIFDSYRKRQKSIARVSFVRQIYQKQFDWRTSWCDPRHQFSKQCRYKQNRNLHEYDNKVANWIPSTTIFRLSTESSDGRFVFHLPPFRVNCAAAAIFQQPPNAAGQKSQLFLVHRTLCSDKMPENRRFMVGIVENGVVQ